MKPTYQMGAKARKAASTLKNLTADYAEHRMREPHAVHWLIIAGGVVELVGGLKHIFGI